MKRILLAPLLVAATASTSWVGCISHTILFPKLPISTTCCTGNNCTTSCV